MARDFRKIEVWKRSHELTLAVYRTTHGFPADERFGLVSQMRRSAASTPTNIAEGCGRGSRKEFLQFLGIASGSNRELAYQLLLSEELGYVAPDAAGPLRAEADEVGRMLGGYMRSLREDRGSHNRPL
ncbi:MAG: four helix bundle protein [Planctomycetota bacterium]